MKQVYHNLFRPSWTLRTRCDKVSHHKRKFMENAKPIIPQTGRFGFLTEPVPTRKPFMKQVYHNLFRPSYSLRIRCDKVSHHKRKFMENTKPIIPQTGRFGFLTEPVPTRKPFMKQVYHNLFRPSYSLRIRCEKDIAPTSLAHH